MANEQDAPLKGTNYVVFRKGEGGWNQIAEQMAASSERAIKDVAKQGDGNTAAGHYMAVPKRSCAELELFVVTKEVVTARIPGTETNPPGPPTDG